MTRREKATNWWYYHKWAVISAVIVLIMLIPVFKNWFGIGVVEPDYQIAVITAAGISEETADELSDAVAELGEDLNGDGEIVVEVKRYTTGAGDRETVMYFAYASSITIQADIAENESHFFLIDDPERFQIAYQILADSDGKLPADDDFDAEGRFLPMGDLRLKLSNAAKEELAPFFMGQRGYYREEEIPYLSEYHQIWKKMTGGTP